MKSFLVQKREYDEVWGTVYSEAELIDYIDISDCLCEEYRIFDISTFGEIKEKFYKEWKPNCLIEIVDSDGHIVVRGYGTDH